MKFTGNRTAPTVLDNYYAWNGCAKATHDYLTKTNCRSESDL
jgi:hypothetical protein